MMTREDILRVLEAIYEDTESDAPHSVKARLNNLLEAIVKRPELMRPAPTGEII